MVVVVGDLELLLHGGGEDFEVLVYGDALLGVKMALASLFRCLSTRFHMESSLIMEWLFCKAVAEVLLESFPEARQKLGAMPFGELNLQTYRNQVCRKSVLQKFVALVDCSYTTEEILVTLFVQDPFEKCFSDKVWRETVLFHAARV